MPLFERNRFHTTKVKERKLSKQKAGRTKHSLPGLSGWRGSNSWPSAWEADALPLSYTRKKGKLSTSHRYDLLPLLPSDPGGIQRELVVYDLPDAKLLNFHDSTNLFVISALLKLSKMNSNKLFAQTVENEQQ